MSTAAATTARIQFRISTCDEHGQVIHHEGEVIDGELLTQRQCFLFIRTTAGAYMCVDAGREDLYDVTLARAVG